MFKIVSNVRKAQLSENSVFKQLTVELYGLKVSV